MLFRIWGLGLVAAVGLLELRCDLGGRVSCGLLVFSQWDQIFEDPVIPMAAVDRLVITP